MIEHLKNEGMLEKLDFSKLDNYKYISDEYKKISLSTRTTNIPFPTMSAWRGSD